MLNALFTGLRGLFQVHAVLLLLLLGLFLLILNLPGFFGELDVLLLGGGDHDFIIGQKVVAGVSWILVLTGFTGFHCLFR